MRLTAAQPEAVDRSSREMARAALGEHGDSRQDLRAGLEVGERLPVLASALVPRAHTCDAAVLDEQRLRRCLRQDVGAAELGLLGQIPR